MDLGTRKNEGGVENQKGGRSMSSRRPRVVKSGSAARIWELLHCGEGTRYCNGSRDERQTWGYPTVVVLKLGCAYGCILPPGGSSAKAENNSSKACTAVLI